MVKGLAITPPIIGRISIGHMVEKNGKRLPEKDDSFTITTQVQTREGWLLHPLHQQLLEAGNAKLRAIPVHLLFNDSDLNLRAEYSAFDRQTGRPLCVGNGEAAKRHTPHGMESFACIGPDHCDYGIKQGCKLFGRLNVQIDGQGDALGSFIFRTTGYNSVRTLAARLAYFEAVSGGQTHYLPLMLKLRAKSTTLSHRAPVYYVDLVLRDGVDLAQAIHAAQTQAAEQLNLGLDRLALEAVAHALFANGAFEDTTDDSPLLLEEYFSENELDVAVKGASNGSDSGSAGSDLPAGSRQVLIANKTLILAKRLNASKPKESAIDI
jgi:hypothetical protein